MTSPPETPNAAAPALQLAEPTPDEARRETILTAGLRWKIALDRRLAAADGDADAETAESLDPDTSLAAAYVIDEIRAKALEDSTSRRWYLTLLAERVDLPEASTA